MISILMSHFFIVAAINSSWRDQCIIHKILRSDESIRHKIINDVLQNIDQFTQTYCLFNKRFILFDERMIKF